MLIRYNQTVGGVITGPDAFVQDFDHFFSIVSQYEYPYYESLGISWHKH